MSESRIEKRDCPGCGVKVDFTITPGLRGADVIIMKRDPHKAPCGRACAEGRDVSIRDAMSGLVHHRMKCECKKEGRGYPRPQGQPPGSTA